MQITFNFLHHIHSLRHLAEDIIYNRWSTNYSTIDGGDGNDTIQNESGYLTASGWDAGNYLSINGGNGNDSISNSGSNVTSKAATVMIPLTTTIAVLQMLRLTAAQATIRFTI